MKTLKKIVIILITVLCVVMFIQSNMSLAASDIYGEVKNMAAANETNGAVTSANNIAGAVISIAKVICAGVAIIMITVIAMKYMMAAPSEKADIKKHAVVYVVGAIIMFAASAILQIIQDFAVKSLPE